jgi:hypothetical protein
LLWKLPKLRRRYKYRRIRVKEPEMTWMLRGVALLFFAGIASQSFGQSFVYVEPGNAACPMVSPSAPTLPKPAKRGESMAGAISVACGFEKGSYTVTLSSTDPGATFSPKSFLVNFGSVSGTGSFSITFATLGVQSISVAITSNMGSPALSGRFLSLANEFEVLLP